MVSQRTKYPSEFRNPPRQLGRVDGPTWKLIKKAAASSGKSFTKWALDILLREANKELIKNATSNRPT